MAIARYVPFFLLFRGKKTKFVSENPQILSPPPKKNTTKLSLFLFGRAVVVRWTRSESDIRYHRILPTPCEDSLISSPPPLPSSMVGGLGAPLPKNGALSSSGAELALPVWAFNEN